MTSPATSKLLKEIMEDMTVTVVQSTKMLILPADTSSLTVILLIFRQEIPGFPSEKILLFLL